MRKKVRHCTSEWNLCRKNQGQKQGGNTKDKYLLWGISSMVTLPAVRDQARVGCDGSLTWAVLKQKWISVFNQYPIILHMIELNIATYQRRALFHWWMHKHLRSTDPFHYCLCQKLCPLPLYTTAQGRRKQSPDGQAQLDVGNVLSLIEIDVGGEAVNM